MILQVSLILNMNWLPYILSISCHVAMCSMFLILQVQLPQPMSWPVIDVFVSHLILRALAYHLFAMPLKAVTSIEIPMSFLLL
jgi:hypothetical protein